MNKIINLSLITLLSFFLLTGCGCNKKDQDETKVNTNENVIKNQELEAFKFTNTSLIFESNNSLLETAVTNTSDETEYLEDFKIYVRDTEGNEIVTMTGFVGGTIKPGETKIISSTYGEDLTNAASIDYEIVR